MSSLKKFKNLYDKLKNDHVRSMLLSTAERLGMHKDIVRMDTNGYCNVRCIMCNQVVAKEKNQIMPFDDFKKIIDIFAPTTRMLYLSCGYEPLVTPMFTQYLQYANSKGIPFISFCTNALKMNSEIISSIVDLGIDEIIISMNGFCTEDYNRIMKGSDYERVCANVKALTDYKRKQNKAKPHIRINTILLKSNLLNFDSMYQFLMEHEIDTVQFRELVSLESQNDPDEVEKELLSNLSYDEYEEIRIKINDMAKQLGSLGKEIILPSIFNENPALKPGDCSTCPDSDLSIEKKHNSKKHSCAIPYFSYWINWKGEVRVCGYDDKALIGNALDQEMKALKAERKEFQRIALAGECSCELCAINIDSSTIV